MKNYLQRFRRYISKGSDVAVSGTNDVDFDEENDEARQSSETSSISPLGRPSSARHSFGGAVRKLKRSATARTSYSARESNAYESSEEESSAARLSRRSSVLVDLFALFRRSSSIGHSGRYQPQKFRDNEEIDESEDEEAEYQEMSKEKLLEAIRQKKEIIGKVRLQPWNMRRKRRTLKVAQRHLQRQKAQVSKWHLYKVESHRRLKQLWRWIKNMGIYLIPWESKIKRIESHFGSVVSSYFIFLRWVLNVNITMSMILMFFVTIPEWLADMQADTVRLNRTQHIKIMPQKVRQHADELNTILDFGGYLQYSYLFYGFYSSETFFGNLIQYNVPIAYFCVNLFILAFCLFIILKKMTSNTRKSKLSSGKQEQYVFTWKVFTGWDYNIGNSETSSSLFKANVIKLQEATADYNKKIKQKWTWMTFVMRILVNTIILCMFALSVYAIYQVAQITEKDTFLKQNAVSITVVVTTILFPPIFELILRLESYRPRTALRTHLFRVLFFYLINYFTLIYSLFKMLNNLESEMRANELSNRLLFEQQTESFHIVHNPYTYNQSYYEVVPSRSLRHLNAFQSYPKFNETVVASMSTILGLSPPSSAPFVYYNNAPVTTIEPLRPWTTIFPNYGPFGVGVYNPKAIVVSDKKNKKVHETIYESRAIGTNADWSPAAAKATQGPVILNYTSTPKHHYQMYRATTNYDDLCWETLIGQEITKIVTTDLVLTIVAILVIDFLRDIWIRYCATWWCWDIEDTFPEYAEFKVAENVLHLVNNQGMIWLGTILVPMLPMINNINLIILMYIRAWACMTCNVPARQIFRASRSSNFYLWILLLMLCMSTLPVGFVIASKKPSKNCGPFGGHERFYSVISKVLHNNLNKNIFDVIQYIMSPGIVIPVLLLMLLIIYFLVLLVSGLKAANTDLSKQLTHERTEEKKKIFELAGGGRKRHSQFTFHRPSDYKLHDGSDSHQSSTHSRLTKEFSQPLQQKDLNAGSIESDANINDCNSSRNDGLRTSWHSGIDSSEQRAAFSSLSEKKSTYKKRTACIRRTATERPERPNIIENPFLSRNSSSEDQLNILSKSPIGQTRCPLFLPSLQSVNEDEVDDEDIDREVAHRNIKKSERKRNSESSDYSEKKKSDSEQSQDSIEKSSSNENFQINKPPVKLTFKQKMMMWIGLADPNKLFLQEHLRQKKAKKQLENEQEEFSDESSEEHEDVNKSRCKQNENDVESGFALRRHSPYYRHDELKKPKKSVIRFFQQTAYQSNQWKNIPPQTVIIDTAISTSSSLTSRESGFVRCENKESSIEQTDDIFNGKKNDETALLIASNRRVNVCQSPLLLEEADFSVTFDDVVIKEEADDEADKNDVEKNEELIVVAEVNSTVTSGNEISQKKITVNGISRPPLFYRSSRTPAHCKETRINRDILIEKDNTILESSSVIDRRKQNIFSPETNKLTLEKRFPQNSSCQMQECDNPTLALSKKGSFWGGLSSQIILPSAVNEDSLCYSDPRLLYANPYCSYTAAMCSQISISDNTEQNRNNRLSSLARSYHSSQEQIQMNYPPSHHSMNNAKYILPSLHQDGSISQSSMQLEYEGIPLLPLLSLKTTQQVNQHQQTLPAMFAVGEPARHFDCSTISSYAPPHHFGISDDYPTSMLFDKQLPGNEFQKPKQLSPMFHHINRLSTAPPEEDGSTSGRGTIPPGYYTESPSNSSPEFGRPKYRIAKSPLTGHRSDQGIGGGADSSDTSIRRYNIRQKSALGATRSAILQSSEKSLSSSPTSPLLKRNVGNVAIKVADADQPYSQQTTV